MAYIGKSPDGTGVRSRFYYTQSSGGGTSVSGSSDDGTSLAFSDGAYVDVFLNGVLLVAGTDYNTSTANTIAGLAALANGDVVEVVVYDIFTVADTVSSLNGGTFSNNVTINGDLIVDTNALFVDASANEVGIGTTTPATYTDYVSGSNAPSVVVAGSQPSYVLADTDVSGSSSTLGITKSGDSTVINNLGGGNIDVYNNGGHRMRIDSSGNIGIGTTTLTGSGTPDETNDGVGVRILPNGFLGIGRQGNICAQFNRSDDGKIVKFRRGGTTVGSVEVSSSSTAYNTSSDHRLKENVADMTGAIARVKQLAPKRFNFIVDADTTVDGFLAHEAQTVVPEAISGTHNEVDDDGNAVMQGIDQSKLVPLLTGALKEAIAKIETLETKVAALEAGE